MKYKVELRCDNCDAVINETVEIDNLELAQHIAQNALINPLVGWCDSCDMKPTPHIIEIKE